MCTSCYQWTMRMSYQRMSHMSLIEVRGIQQLNNDNEYINNIYLYPISAVKLI